MNGLLQKAIKKKNSIFQQEKSNRVYNMSSLKARTLRALQAYDLSAKTDESFIRNQNIYRPYFIFSEEIKLSLKHSLG